MGRSSGRRTACLCPPEVTRWSPDSLAIGLGGKPLGGDPSQGWPCDGICPREQTPALPLCTWEGAVPSREEASPGTKSTDTQSGTCSTLNREKSVSAGQAPHLWYFVMEARADNIGLPQRARRGLRETGQRQCQRGAEQGGQAWPRSLGPLQGDTVEGRPESWLTAGARGDEGRGRLGGSSPGVLQGQTRWPSRQSDWQDSTRGWGSHSGWRMRSLPPRV